MTVCNQCGADSPGLFCASCGASMKTVVCVSCATEVPPGSRFCTECGTAVRESGRRAAVEGGTNGGEASALLGSSAGWWVSGGLLLVLLAILGGQVLTDANGSDVGLAPGAPGSSGSLGPAPNVDLSTMTSREAADALFNRVMGALAVEDTVEVVNFLPMALDAYELARPLDEDGLFHLSLLERFAGDYRSSLDSALEGLEDNPDHLLNLSSAAEAARELGYLEAAQEYYERMLSAWDAELAEERPEYTEHSPLMPLIRSEAEEFLEEVDL